MHLTNISIKKPVFITVIFLALLIVGLLSYTGLNVNDMPEADLPMVTVTIVDKGVAPDQLETNITKKVENAIGEISGVKHINSSIVENATTTAVVFEMSKNNDTAVQEVKDKISAIRSQLPSEMDEPVISKMDINALPIVSIAVTGKGDIRELSKTTEDLVVKKLQTITGVGSVTTYGKVDREIKIKLDQDKMASYGLTINEIVNSLKSDNMDVPGGTLTDKNNEIAVKTDSKITEVSDFNNVLVGKRNGTEIRLEDVGEVIDGAKDKEDSAYLGQKNAIGLDVVKQSGANTVKVAQEIRKNISTIQKDLPSGMHLEVVKDNSIPINDSLNEVIKTIIEGCMLAILIVFLFLREWESTLISAISLPISIVTTFIAMKLMNFTLNTMSLMALSLAVGLLIDDAIVVIENIVRHLHMGKSGFKAAVDGTSEIGLAVLATTLAVVSVFLPVAMVNGIVGKYFIEFGLTIVFSILISLLVSFTLVPLLATKLLKTDKKHNKTFIGKFLDWFNKTFDAISEKYGQFLKVALGHRLIVMIMAIVLFIGSISLVPQLGMSFMPSVDNGYIDVNAILDSGLSMQAAEDKAKSLIKILEKSPDVDYVYTTVEKDSVSLLVKLPEKNKRKESSKQIAVKIRKVLQGVPGVSLTVSPESMVSTGSKDAAYVIKGDDFTVMKKFANNAMQLISRDPHAVDVSMSYRPGNPVTKVIVDRDKAADLGVSSATVASTINTLFSGTTVSKYETSKDLYDVNVSIRDDQRKNVNSLNGIYVSNSSGNLVSLDQVTKKVFSTTPASIKRYDKARCINLEANVVGAAAGDFSNKYLEVLQKDAPKGVAIATGSATETMQEGQSSLGIAMIMSIIFLFFVMAAQFESFIDPIAILVALPLALIGAFLGLYIGGSEMGIMAMIGIIMLIGLVAKNAILLVDFTIKKREEGVPLKEAIIEAGTVRLRPILMTTLAMIFGMIPLLLATGSGTEMRIPMAQSVIGGLISSTLLTLFVVPCVYTYLDDLKNKFKKKKHKSPLANENTLKCEEGKASI